MHAPRSRPASRSCHTHAPFSAPPHTRNTQTENRISGAVAVKLRWNRAAARATCPPTRGVQAGGVAELHLLEMHDKMDKMMVWMSTGQVDLTHCRTVQQ